MKWLKKWLRAPTTAQRTVGQSVKLSWDCSQIEKEEEEEEEVWEKENQMKLQWAEDQKLEKFWNEEGWKEPLCRRKSCKKTPELVVHERMSRGEKVRGTREKKKAKGCSTEEMKDKTNSLREEDTEEMRTRRCLNQEEMDQCWKNVAERMEEEVLGKCSVENSSREAYRGRGTPLEWRRVRRSRKYRIRKWREDCWAGFLAMFREYILQRLQSMHEDPTEGAEMKRQQRMNVMKDMTKKIRSKGRMDAENPMWVAELLVADCGEFKCFVGFRRSCLRFIGGASYWVSPRSAPVVW